MEAQSPTAGEDTAKTPRRRSRLRRGLLLAGTSLLVLLLAVAGGMYFLSERLTNNVGREQHVFTDIRPDERPKGGEGMTFLLAGVDRRSEEPTTGSGAQAPVFVYGEQRSDVLMLLHLSADRTAASVVSLPRDSWVEIPGHGMAKINAAFSWGGPSLAVRAVEARTGVRIDHFGVIDFSGFEAMADAVGGIDVRVAEATESRGVHFDAGLNHLDGHEALVYVRQRHGLPGGDLARIQRQQAAMRALLHAAGSSGALRNPARVYDLLDAVSNSVGVDETFSNNDLRSLAFGLRNLRPEDMTFATAPVSSIGMEGKQSVVRLDADLGSQVWEALEAGELADLLAEHPDLAPASTPP